jgi:hypothetical protein
MEPATMKTILNVFLLISLCFLVSSCTTHKTTEWGEWYEQSSEFERSHEKARFKNPPELSFTSDNRLEQQIPSIYIEVEVYSDVEETKHFERTRQHTTKTHYPLISKYKNQDIFELFAHVLLYPFEFSSYKYNTTDHETELDYRDDVHHYKEWRDLHELDEHSVNLHVKQLNLTSELLPRYRYISLSPYQTDSRILQYLMESDELTVSIVGQDETVQISLSWFKKWERARKDRVKAEIARKNKAEADRLADIAEQKRLDQLAADKKKKHRKSILSSIDSLKTSVTDFEKKGDYASALKEQRKLITLIQENPEFAGDQFNVAVERAIELASGAGDIDAAMELVKLKS